MGAHILSILVIALISGHMAQPQEIESSLGTINHCVIYNEAKTECLKCSETYYVEKAKKKQCLQCSQGCKTCQDKSECIKCSENFYLSSHFCYSCPASCLKCLSPEKCTACKSGFIKIDQYQCGKEWTYLQTLLAIGIGASIVLLIVCCVVCIKKQNTSQDDGLYSSEPWTVIDKNNFMGVDRPTGVTCKAVKFIANGRKYKEDGASSFLSSS
jgi:hypothetical protein